MALVKKIKRYDSLEITAQFIQIPFVFDLGDDLRRERELNPPLPPEKRKFVTWRHCLRCERKYRSKWPGLCDRCKRHEDYLDGGEDDSSVSS